LFSFVPSPADGSPQEINFPISEASLSLTGFGCSRGYALCSLPVFGPMLYALCPLLVCWHYALSQGAVSIRDIRAKKETLILPISTQGQNR
jgi:hypothetical protein